MCLHVRYSFGHSLSATFFRLSMLVQILQPPYGDCLQLQHKHQQAPKWFHAVMENLGVISYNCHMDHCRAEEIFIRSKIVLGGHVGFQNMVDYRRRKGSSFSTTVHASSYKHLSCVSLLSLQFS